MRILMMMGLLALPLAASSDDKTSTREESREAAQAAGDDVKEAGQDAKESARETSREARQEMKDAGSTGSATAGEMRDESRAGSQASADRMKQGPFADANNFEVKGKLHKVSKSSVTIRRDEDKLPPAKLNVDRQTKIEVDGEQATWAQLKQGADVKASFNLRDDKPMAVEIKAEKTDAQKQGEERREEQMERQQEQRRQ